MNVKPNLTKRLGILLDAKGHIPQEDAQWLLAIAGKAYEVRWLQREYFKNRSPQILEDSKAAEKSLDAMLTESSQGGLF